MDDGTSGNILLVWQNIPDRTDCYWLRDGGEAAELALKSAGKFINGDDLADDHPIFQLNEMFRSIPAITIDHVLEGPFTKVVVCGFLA